jgi:hypothetical protein
MNLSRKQKMLLHSIPNKLGIDAAQRRIIQWNLGGFYSAADPVTREGFIGVMAHYEMLAGGDLRTVGCHSDRGYWQRERDKAMPADGQREILRRLAEQIGMAPEALDSFLAGPKMSSGACTGLADCPPYWLGRAIEAAKAIGRRGGLRSRRTGS